MVEYSLKCNMFIFFLVSPPIWCFDLGNLVITHYDDVARALVGENLAKKSERIHGAERLQAHSPRLKDFLA